jgi:hypothetical protein
MGQSGNPTGSRSHVQELAEIYADLSVSFPEPNAAEVRRLKLLAAYRADHCADNEVALALAGELRRGLADLRRGRGRLKPQSAPSPLFDKIMQERAQRHG